MKFKVLKLLLRIPFIHRLILFSRAVILPGFAGMSLFVVSKFFIQGIKNGDLGMRASSLAFNFFLALFPSIIFLFTLIPYIPIDNFQNYLFLLMEEVLPHAAFEATKETIRDIIKNPNGGLLSFGFLGALYFSTNGFKSMIKSFNRTFHTIEERSPLQTRLVAISMVFIATILLSLAIALTITSSVIINFINLGDVTIVLIKLADLVIIIGLCLFFISFNYYLGTKRKEGFKFISPGSILATALILLASGGFGFYVNNFGNYNKLYGSIGTLMVMMIWLLIISFILLLGFDLNASINNAKKRHSNRLK